ncbi:hypothetical protein [Mycobacterium sp.]|uniref:hypothetical protein n=1 Tax=Mycobacterium sp. TaxID=1785 RepID=UPI003BA9AFB7
MAISQPSCWYFVSVVIRFNYDQPVADANRVRPPIAVTAPRLAEATAGPDGAVQDVSHADLWPSSRGFRASRCLTRLRGVGSYAVYAAGESSSADSGPLCRQRYYPKIRSAGKPRIFSAGMERINFVSGVATAWGRGVAAACRCPALS